jgi:hypothetical protein
MSNKLTYGRLGDGMTYSHVKSPERRRQARSARHEGADRQAEKDINPLTLLTQIYQRLCSAESKIDDLLLYLKGSPAQNQIQLRDAIFAHLSGDRTLIEEYVKQNKTH